MTDRNRDLRNGDMPAAALPNANSVHRDWWGLTKREMLAAMAMQGMASHAFCDRADVPRLAQIAVETADALLAELEKPVRS